MGLAALHSGARELPFSRYETPLEEAKYLLGAYYIPVGPAEEDPSSWSRSSFGHAHQISGVLEPFGAKEDTRNH